jgi:hypothetical protein
LQALASALAQAGGANQDEALFQQARQVAEAITYPGSKAVALQALAGELAAVGKIRSAHQIAQEQVDDGQKALTLAIILQRASVDSLPKASSLPRAQ